MFCQPEVAELCVLWSTTKCFKSMATCAIFCSLPRWYNLHFTDLETWPELHRPESPTPQLKIKTKQQSGSAQHRWPPTILIPDDWFLFSSSNVQTGHLVSRTNLDTTPPFWTLPGPIRRRVRITLSYFRFHVCLVTVAFIHNHSHCLFCCFFFFFKEETEKKTCKCLADKH